MVLDCRLGHTTSCLVAEKSKFQNNNFSTITNNLNQVRMEEGKFKKVGCWNDQTKREKKDVEEVDYGWQRKREGK